MKENSSESRTARGVYRRNDSPYLWISYTMNGRQVRESSGTTSLDEALRILEKKRYGLEGAGKEKTNTKRAKSEWKRVLDSVYFEERVYRLYRSCKNNSISKNVGFSLTQKDIFEMAVRSHGYCEVSGIRFCLETRGAHGKRLPFAPSIDRINPSEGYTKENCRMVCFIVNVAMSDFGEQVFMSMVRQIADSARPAKLRCGHCGKATLYPRR